MAPPLPTHAADATDLRAEIESLRTAVARTHRLSMLGTLAGSIAHEFNNLLTPVKCYAEMALEAPGDKALTAKALERAQHGCDRASRIASAILAFAGERGSPGGLQEDRRAGVARAVREALLCLAQEPGRMGIELELRIDPELQAGIDQTALQQVILNLVLNAIKAMRSGGGGRLSITAWSSAAAPPLRLCGSTWNTGPGPQVFVEVADTGCGIDPSRLPHVFEAFVTGLGGTGLGLTICKQLVEGAGGQIEVASQPGQGTKFTITLPSAGDPAAADTLRATA